jgi:glyoxylase-like metal-dependent hydrolase (beta-lactamase superfamily II)
MSLSIRAFFHEPTHSVAYLVWDGDTRRAAIIDSVLDYDGAAGKTSTTFVDTIAKAVTDERLQVDWLLETHIHADHMAGIHALQEKVGGKTAIGAGIEQVQRTFKDIFGLDDLTPDGSQFDRLLGDGERIPLGNLAIEAIATPGHTPGFLSYRVENAVFVGDTLLMPDYGTARADFPGGDASVLYRSIHRLFRLPDDTRVFVGHDYKAPGRASFAWEAPMAEQRAHNVHIHEGIGEAEFVEMRNERDKSLTLPTLMLPSLQVNVRAGRLPPAENGTRYLKIPINKF